MFGKRVRGLSLGLLTLAIPIILVAAACADDGEEAPADTATADVAQPSPVTPGTSVIEAVAAYVTETGLNGETLEVADPINCNAFVHVSEEEKPIGQICINFKNSQFSETTGVIEVWAYGTESAWELSFELQNLAWVVTGAEGTTPEADEE